MPPRLNLTEQYVAAIASGDLDVELNADSVIAFLGGTKRHVAYAEAATELGYAPFGEEIEAIGPEDIATLEFSNTDTLVELVLEGAAITDGWTLKQLDELVPDPVPDSIRAGLSEVLEASIENGFLPAAVPVDMLILGYALALRGGLNPEETAQRTNFVNELQDALQTALYNVDGVA